MKLNVGGERFETTFSTLKGSAYFRSWLGRWNFENEIFIDRSGKIFEHVLGVLRDPDYPYPEEHLSELVFYGIPFTANKKIDREEARFVKIEREPQICDFVRYYGNIHQVIAVRKIENKNYRYNVPGSQKYHKLCDIVFVRPEKCDFKRQIFERIQETAKIEELETVIAEYAD